MLSRSEKDAILFHLTFFLVAFIAIVFPAAQAQGGVLRILFATPSSISSANEEKAALLIEPCFRLGLILWALLIGYHMAVAWMSRQRFHQNWLLTMRVLVPLGVFMIFPDAFLAMGLKTLVFPDMGVGMIYNVSAFITLMWPIPLFICTLVGRGMEARGYGMWQAALGAGLVGLVQFALSEGILTRIPIWYAVENSCTVLGSTGSQLSHVAVYVLFPEFLLGMVTFLACRYCLWRYHEKSQLVPMSQIIFGSFLIMTMYLGSIVFTFMLIDGDKL